MPIISYNKLSLHFSRDPNVSSELGLFNTVGWLCHVTHVQNDPVSSLPQETEAPFVNIGAGLLTHCNQFLGSATTIDVK